MLLKNNWMLAGLLALLVGCGVDVEQTKVPGGKTDGNSGQTGEVEPEGETCDNTAAPYNGMNVSDCVAAIFQCADDEKRFDDECGCGCEKLATPPPPPPACDYADPNKRYTQKDLSQCTAALFNCPAEDEKRFDDECGCGCEKIAAPSLPTITTNKKAYQLGENIEMTMTNGTGKDIFLEGCTQFWLEISTPAGWERIGGHPCFWEGYAVLVSDQQTATETFSTSTPGTYRIAATYSESASCSTSLTLSDANCAPLHVATSASFTVQ